MKRKDSLLEQIATTISSDMHIFYFPIDLIFSLSLMKNFNVATISDLLFKNYCLSNLYHPCIVFLSKIAILLCFSSSILFYGAKGQNMEETGVFTTLLSNQFYFT